MNWLAIDTAMNACGVGLRRTDGQFFSAYEAMERGQSERLMPMIMDVSGRAGVELSHIDAYAITVGPGTFTGLRVGLATVRALSQVSNKPAIGISTFDVLSDQVSQRPACILIETKRTDYYVCAYDAAGAIGEGKCMSPDELKTFIKPDWILAGDAVDRAKSETGLNNKAISIVSPDLELLIKRAEKQKSTGFPEPLYLREADVSVARRAPARIV